MRTSKVRKFGIRDIVDVAKVDARTAEMRAELTEQVVSRLGFTIEPGSEHIVLMEPEAENDGRLTQEIRLSVLTTYKGAGA